MARIVAHHEAIGREIALDRINRAAHPRIAGGKKPDERNEKRAGIELVAPVAAATTPTAESAEAG